MAPLGSCTEQGPTTTRRRGSSRRKMRQTVRRPSTTVRLLSSRMGSSSFSARGGLSRTNSVTFRFCVGNIISELTSWRGYAAFQRINKIIDNAHILKWYSDRAIAEKLNEFRGGGSGGAVVDDGHEGAGHARGVGVLNDVAAVNDAGGALLDKFFGAFEDFLVGRFAAPANEDGDAAGDFDDFVVNGDVVGGIGFDDVGAEFNGLADERQDFFEVAIHHVTAGFLIGLKNERLDHEGHGVAVAFGFDFKNVQDALVGDFGLLGNAEEIHDHATRVEAQSLFDGLIDHAAEKSAREGGAVNVGNIGAEDERGFFFAGEGLEVVRLADGELNGVGRGLHEGFDRFFEILDALQEAAFVEKSVVHGDIKAAVGLGIEQTIEAILFHEGRIVLRRGGVGKCFVEKRACGKVCCLVKRGRMAAVKTGGLWKRRKRWALAVMALFLVLGFVGWRFSASTGVKR